MTDTRFLSLGLDIGTTTTHLIFSELEIAQIEEPGRVPRPGIGERKIVHRGRVRFTPLAEGDRIDAAAVEAIIREEYAASGFRPEQVRSGAVLITGESARKDNAEEVARRIADLAGGFVAAAAGPNLEGLLAGRGAGAADLSKRFRRRVCNIDIGGGTANYAWFDRGRFVEAACLRVGGRHVRFDPAGRVTGLTEVGAFAAARAGVRLTPGAEPPAGARAAVAGVLAEAVLAAIAGDWPDNVLTVTRPSAPPDPPDTVMFSGGVGELMRAGPAASADPLRFGDLGPDLAAALLGPRGRSPAEWAYPDEPIRATVIGAGMYSGQISGDTIWAEPSLLPLTNLPVLRPWRPASHLLDGDVAAAIRTAAVRADLDWSAHAAAVMLPSLVSLDLAEIRTVAGRLAAAAKSLSARPPLVLLMTDDLGRTLGKLIAPALGGPLIAVDELAEGSDVDYVDIGRPVGGVVPVVLKSLVFG
jgi:ethanolamine utilization protein EutA